MKVSIIVPVHNSENSLKRCLDSILLQDYENIECIIIENGSIDNSKNICLLYARKNKKIIFKSIDDVGVSKARNLGLELSTGDIVGFCDADDFLESNAISKVIKEFLYDTKLAAVFGGFYWGYFDKNQCLKKEYKGLKPKIITSKDAIHYTINNDSVMGSVWNKYYRKGFVENIQFDTKLSYCEDMHFNIRVLSLIPAEYRIKVIGTPIYCYMYNEFGVTNNNSLFFDDAGQLKYIITIKKIINDCKLDNKSIEYLKMKIACFAIDYMWKGDRDNKQKLFIELKKNYSYLLNNVYVNDWKRNFKRVFKGGGLILMHYFGF